VPVPGPSALVAALAASGLPTDAFEFRGFLPAKSGQRRTVLEAIRSAEPTVIFYEAPHRIREAVDDIVAVLGPERPMVIARELTKVHEEFLRGTAGELAEQIRDREVKGEITILIGKAVSGEKISGVVDMRARLREIMRQQNLDEKAALKVLAKERGVSKSEVYREVQRSTKSPKR
jgi:16S rRNA (cytidine1402-2'-O)-methyltransferase